ncbi:nitric oxide-sensing protein NosP [Halomonas alimentaria]|uniref:nitric oxide-sensing protein NosP n=1 Tax=Halomonas alimentaria TaxID=147248 RepID=UPI0024916377|nr:nitric oxide-sensing protein NosP [Halomonas alimentaria]
MPPDPTAFTGAPPLCSAVSRHADPAAAVAELGEALRHPALGFVLFFCSADYPLEDLSRAITHTFGRLPVVGCTTAGEISPTGYERGCIVAIGFARGAFAVATALVADLDRFDLLAAQRLVDGLLERCRPEAPAGAERFALTLLDGLSSREEQVLATLEAALGRIPGFGGSAGDDNRLARTHVYAEGHFHSRAAVVVMVATRLPFEVFTTHHLQPLDHKLVVTRADSETRRVLELNALPAAEEYARLVGVPVAALDAQAFALHPLAVRIADAHYVRSVQRVNPDGSLSFYCAVETGIVLTAMRPTPMLEQLEVVFDGLAQRLGEPALVIGCDCFLRRLEIEARGELAAASRLLARGRVIGFNTYGEQHHGMHLNQTFTGVAIGSATSA